MVKYKVVIEQISQALTAFPDINISNIVTLEMCVHFAMYSIRIDAKRWQILVFPFDGNGNVYSISNECEIFALIKTILSYTFKIKVTVDDKKRN